MTDDELRGLIRAAIQRHMSSDHPQAAAEGRVSTKLVGIQASEAGLSFREYPLERAAGDTSCLIEPAVQCNHCGFCKCHGH